MVHDRVWAEAGAAPDGCFLCIGCLEQRLGRRLTAQDFTDTYVNRPSPWNTARLATAKKEEAG